MLNATIMSVIMLNVVMLNDAAQFYVKLFRRKNRLKSRRKCQPDLPPKIGRRFPRNSCSTFFLFGLFCFFGLFSFGLRLRCSGSA
jgi:hypothetical protein